MTAMKSRYPHRRNDGQFARRVMIPYLLTEREEACYTAWAKRRNQSLRDWLFSALCGGIDDRASAEMDEDTWAEEDAQRAAGEKSA